MSEYVENVLSLAEDLLESGFPRAIAGLWLDVFDHYQTMREIASADLPIGAMSTADQTEATYEDALRSMWTFILRESSGEEFEDVEGASYAQLAILEATIDEIVSMTTIETQRSVFEWACIVMDDPEGTVLREAGLKLPNESE